MLRLTNTSRTFLRKATSCSIHYKSALLVKAPAAISNKIGMFQVQKRNFQSPSEQNTYGFFDSVRGAYEDPRYSLDIKPGEYRDGQLRYWTTDNMGFFIVIVMMMIPPILCAFTLYWLTFHDTETTVFHRNRFMDYLTIHDGYDSELHRHPLFKFCYPVGFGTLGIRDLFYFELESAIEQRKREDSVKVFNDAMSTMIPREKAYAIVQELEQELKAGENHEVGESDQTAQ